MATLPTVERCRAGSFAVRLGDARSGAPDLILHFAFTFQAPNRISSPGKSPEPREGS